MRPRIAHNDPDQFVGFTRRMMEEERDNREDRPLITLDELAIALAERGFAGDDGKPMCRQGASSAEAYAVIHFRDALRADPVVREYWGMIA